MEVLSRPKAFSRVSDTIDDEVSPHFLPSLGSKTRCIPKCAPISHSVCTSATVCAEFISGRYASRLRQAPVERSGLRSAHPARRFGIAIPTPFQSRRSGFLTRALVAPNAEYPTQTGTESSWLFANPHELPERLAAVKEKDNRHTCAYSDCAVSNVLGATQSCAIVCPSA